MNSDVLSKIIEKLDLTSSAKFLRICKKWHNIFINNHNLEHKSDIRKKINYVLLKNKDYLKDKNINEYLKEIHKNNLTELLNYIMDFKIHNDGCIVEMLYLTSLTFVPKYKFKNRCDFYTEQFENLLSKVDDYTEEKNKLLKKYKEDYKGFLSYIKKEFLTIDDKIKEYKKLENMLYSEAFKQNE